MIPQAELARFAKAERALKALALTPAVAAYLAAEQDLAAQTKALKARALVEEAAPGKWAVTLKTTLTVSWKDVWDLLHLRPLIVEALDLDATAARIVRRALEKDASAVFVGKRVSMTVAEVG